MRNFGVLLIVLFAGCGRFNYDQQAASAAALFIVAEGATTNAETLYRRVVLPNSLEMMAGLPGAGYARLTLAREGSSEVACSYKGDGSTYVFESCDDGSVSTGSVVAAHGAVTLTILGSDPAGGTARVRARLAYE